MPHHYASRRYQAGGELVLALVLQQPLQGAQPSQISTVSFGEERPAAFGSDEAAWSQNRRVEFKYTY